MASRFEKFSERARRGLSLAQQEAQRFNHDYIGTERALLGLVRETDGVEACVLNQSVSQSHGQGVRVDLHEDGGKLSVRIAPDPVDDAPEPPAPRRRKAVAAAGK